MQITKRTGETISHEIEITDVEDLIGGEAKFNWTGGEEKECDITGRVVSFELNPTETTEPGYFPFEVRLALNGQVKVIASGAIVLTDSPALK